MSLPKYFSLYVFIFLLENTVSWIPHFLNSSIYFLCFKSLPTFMDFINFPTFLLNYFDCSSLCYLVFSGFVIFLCYRCSNFSKVINWSLQLLTLIFLHLLDSFPFFASSFIFVLFSFCLSWWRLSTNYTDSLAFHIRNLSTKQITDNSV